MKIPPNPPKVMVGQVWRKRTNNCLFLCTGRARNRNGQDAFHFRRYDIKTRTSHAITNKDMWRFHHLIGNWNTIPEYVPWEVVADMLNLV